jgi:lipoprotein-releasing system ATP-binding protein
MNLRIENLNKSFLMDKGLKVDVLKNINLTINSGESVSLIGPSGAGKSTLLHIAGLMDRPDSGKVLLDDI